MTRIYKKGVESRRQPAPSAGKWPHQPTPARLPTRQMPARQSTLHLEREIPPLLTQTLQHQPETITLPCYKTTATIAASATIYRPALTSSPDAPPKKKTRTTLPTRDFIEPPTRYNYSQIKKPYPLHEKYDLQEVLGCKFLRFDAHNIKTNRIDRPDETINIDLPIFFFNIPCRAQ